MTQRPPRQSGRGRAGRIPSASTLFHTIRPLRRRQITGRLRRRLRRIFERPERFGRGGAPDPGDPRWSPRADFLPPGPQNNREPEILSGTLEFLGRSHPVGWPPRWAHPDLPRLWQYHLHYFEHLWALRFDHARHLVSDWIEHHALGRGRVGWEPYPTSLRLLNWCGYFFSRYARETAEDHRFRSQLWKSIFLQAEWLGAHLETHLLGNHLFENGAALALCGSCFSGGPAERWHRIGTRVLREQIPEQILADGGHFERSPMYHARIAYLLTALLNTGDGELARLVEEPSGRAMRALARMSHPDRQIALLNDSALNVANRPEEILDWWGRVSGRDPDGFLGPETFSLPETGYHGARHESGRYLICDAGLLGPDYLLGHAHGDIFSFELSLGGQRVVTDSGVYGYQDDAMRDHCRSTRAHNTVEVDGESQCEFWAVFRVARRGRPRDVVWEPTPDGFRLDGWHDGYQRLRGGPRHRRRLTWHDRGVLMVRDTVASSRKLTVASRLHLHPECQMVELSGNRARVRHPEGEFCVCFAGAGELKAETSFYCPEFGTRIERRALVFSAAGSEIETGFCIADGGGPLSHDLASGATVRGVRFGW